MLRVIVVASEHAGGMAAKGLMNHSFHAMAGNDGPLLRALDELRGDQFLGDNEQSLARLGLFFVFPTWAMNPAIPLGIRKRNVNHGDIGVDPAQERILLACEGTLSPPKIIRSGGLQ